MGLQRGLRNVSFLSILSLGMLLSACGGGGGGDTATAAPPVSSTGPVTPPVTPPPTGGGPPSAPPPSASVPPSAPPTTDSGAAPPPAGSGGQVPPPSATPGVDDAFRVGIDSRALVFKGEQSGAMAPALIVGTGVGVPPSTIYTGSVDLGTSLDRVLVEVDNTQVNFRVYPKLNLAPGEHRGSLQLFACPDEKCVRHFAGSPVTVPYTITVSPAFSVSPASNYFYARSGQSLMTDVAVQVPSGASGYTVKSSADWLEISDVLPGSFKAVAQPMPPGDYLATLTVTSGGRSKDVNIEYAVRGDASTVMDIRPSNTWIDMNAYIDGTGTAALDVVLPSWSTVLDTEIAYDKNGATGWLTLARTGARSLALSASAATLAPGRHQATLILKSGPLAAPVSVPVSFTVGLPSWRFTGNTHFTMAAATTAPELGSSVTVELPQVPSQAWTASTSSSWLTISAGSGTTNGTPLRVAVDPAQLGALENFATHGADVVLQAADSRVPPTTLRFTLDKGVPDVQFVSPSTRLPGEAGTYILRGRGFDAVTDLQAGLQVGGATPLQITRVNDTQLNVRLAGAASGAVEFDIPNGLGVATGKPVLQVVAQGAFPYRAVATAGNKGGLVFDPRRQALYSANKTLQTVMRFAWNGSGWTVASVPVPSIDMVALAPDAATLVATSTTSGIVLLDPDTLAVKGSHGPVAVMGDTLNGSARLAITNDGRAYFQGESWSMYRLHYFDLVTRRFGAVSPAEGSFDFYHGPWFSVSGDGSRLNIVQSGSISSQPPMLYLDSADQTPKANPAGIKHWYEAAQSLRGERFVEGTTRVWDRDFAVIGDLSLSGSNYYGRTPVLSPDGKRVYVLAYHANVFSNYGIGEERPRVYVFDSSTRMTVTTQLPLLGYFTVPDYPTCSIDIYYCNTRPLGTISPDGKTLFFIGDVNMVAAPIPATLTPVQATSLQRAATGTVPRLQGLRLGR